VAAAGNNGQSRPFWPAAFKHVVSVGAVDLRGGPPQLAAFSNYGWWVDVYAPGVEVHSTYLDGIWQLPRDPEPTPLNGYAWWSGTSFAAPQIASLIVKEIPKAGNARRAALAVLARADWEPELGPVLIPDRKIVRH
jgi:subtilisin family serine protease